jgi:hypothetical protein
MNLCGEFVTHRVFGRDKSLKSDDCVTVLFEGAGEKKKFIYPSSIGTFLLPEDKKLAKQMQEYKNEITQTKELKQREAEDKKQEEKLAAESQAKLIKKLLKKTPRKSK